MDVHEPALERPHDLGPDDPHEPGEGDDLDLLCAQEIEDRKVERRTVVERDGVDVHRPNAARPSACERPGVRAIAEDHHDPRADDRVVEERLDVRPLTGGEHRDPRVRHAAHATDGPATVSNVIRPNGTLSVVPGDDRPVKGLERCSRHPAAPGVARCDGCGRPMCLACATPVRGQVFGAECLGDVLGSDAPSELEDGARAPDARIRTIGRIGFAAAVLATALPWSRFGPGSEAFGAWGQTAWWSMVAGVAAIAGLTLTLAQLRPSLRAPRWDAVAAALGAVVALAALVAVLFPPAFSRPWLGPWVAVAAGVVACGASVVAGRTVGRPADIGI